MRFFRDYFWPRGKQVTFWGSYNRALIPLYVTVITLLILQFATGLQLILSAYFWVAIGVGALISAYVFFIGVIPWTYKVTQTKRRGDSKD